MRFCNILSFLSITFYCISETIAFQWPFAYYPYNNFIRKDKFARAIELLSKETSSNIECVYSCDKLKCSRLSSLIECEANKILGDFDNIIESFGIESLKSDSKSINFTNFKLPLYPILNQKWLNHTIWKNDRFISFSLFSLESIQDNGIRILNENCFKDLINLFESAVSNNVVILSSNDLFRINQGNVTLLGNLIVK